MGQFFSDKTEEGIRLIWLDYMQGKAIEGVKLLEEAAREGDPDAFYFLSRCLLGRQYVWRFLDFPEDEERSAILLKESVRRGSAVGVLGAMRCGELTPQVQATMPFSSLKEARDVVLEKAEGGHPFCQYMIGNTYFWGDVIEIDHIDVTDIETLEKELVTQAIPWLEKAVAGGVELALSNLYNIFYTGEHGLPKDPQKAEEWVKFGAEKGWPEWQRTWAAYYYEKKQYPQALEWYQKAAEGGDQLAWYDVGYQYEFGEGVAKDEGQALKCFEKGADWGSPGCCYRAGRLYYFGRGVQQDYGRAFQLLSKAADQKYTQSYGLLGESYLKGRGTTQDFAKAKKLFEEGEESPVCFNGLGEIYADGLGVPEDIKRGVAYFQQAAGNYQTARENLARFRKTLFGKWVRR